MTSGDGQTTRRTNPRTMRLPGSVAEIEGSPAGPKIGAFFDLDGTLVAGFTGVIMTRDRLRRGQMGVGEFIGMVQAGLNHQLGRSEFEDLIGKGARMLRGSSLGDIDELAERLFVQKIMGRIYPEMRDLVRAHMERGHTVVLSSSALTVQVEPVARFLGIKNVLSNRFVTDDDGLITGEVKTPIIWGPGKARAVQAFAAENGVDLSKSYFYADGDEDVALMYLVGNPRPTNPAGKLAAVAAKRGWPVLRFSSRSGSNPVSQLRTAAGVASMVPIAAGALGLGLLTRNKRTGVNFFTSAFGRALLTATGVNINLLGKENLTAKRPAVFIFNHRNQVDPIIAGRLVNTNFTSVGKKELESDPIAGTLGKVMDVAFIDRDNAKAAVESLKKVEELARKGLSVLIAPEGTRLDTTEVGPFKKGPFRIAMSAGIPIVPIVIRNAEVISARDSTTFNPGTVDVVVYPPIPTDDWTVQNLPDRIAEVRQLYLDTLKDWPHDKVPKIGPYARPKSAAKKASAKKTAAPKKAPAKKAAEKRLPRRQSPRHRPRRHRLGRRRPRRDGRDRRPDGQLLHHRRCAGAGLGVIPCGTRVVERLAATPTSRASRLQGRRARASRRGPATGGARTPRRGTGGRRGPRGGPGARLLGTRRPAHPLEGGRVDLRARHLSAAGDSATPHSQEEPVTRAGGGGRAREGF